MSKHIAAKTNTYRSLAVVLIGSAWTPAIAQEADGCSQFTWSVAKERELFSAQRLAAANSGAGFATVPENGIVVTLAKGDTVVYPLPLGRTPKDPASFGGFIVIDDVKKPGIYQVALSEEAWIDVIQDGNLLPAITHSGRKDCPGIRKSLRFELKSGPLIIQLSGVSATTAKVAVMEVP